MSSDFSLLVVFRVKIWLENGQFSIFFAFFDFFAAIFSPTTIEIFISLGQQRDKMDTKQVQKTGG